MESINSILEKFRYLQIFVRKKTFRNSLKNKAQMIIKLEILQKAKSFIKIKCNKTV